MTKFTTWCGSLRVIEDDRRLGHTTMLDVRRVKTDTQGEHVQIAVTVEKHHTKRTVSQYGYLSLTPDQVPTLIAALTKLHPPYDPLKRIQSSDADDRAFYGLESAS
jgi:hypothetical protein